MLNPYYLIKSDVISDTKYIGGGHTTEGGQVLPVMGVVNKENGFGDYYFQTSTKNVFTITQPTTLTSITTSIHDPDMSFARVDKNCSVLYMVEKQNNNNLNIVDTLVQEKQFNPQALNPISLTDEEYSEYFKNFILNKAEMKVEEQQFVQSHEAVTGEEFTRSREALAAILERPTLYSSSQFADVEQPSADDFYEARRQLQLGSQGEVFEQTEPQPEPQENFSLAQFTETGDPIDHSSQAAASTPWAGISFKSPVFSQTPGADPVHARRRRPHITPEEAVRMEREKRSKMVKGMSGLPSVGEHTGGWGEKKEKEEYTKHFSGPGSPFTLKHSRDPHYKTRSRRIRPLQPAEFRAPRGPHARAGKKRAERTAEDVAAEWKEYVQREKAKKESSD
jgi:hypothetical protein